MASITDRFKHKQVCSDKQQQRSHKLGTLPVPYQGPLSTSERNILGKRIDELVQDVRKDVTSPIDILRAYGKASTLAHAQTNCLTEIMFPEAEDWINNGEINLQGPLAGIPVSLKDTIAVKGFDVSVGYSGYANRPYDKDGIMVRLLKQAGAVPFVKTALPITLLSFESSNDLWGRCTNPHNKDYSPGGSTGGEGALLAAGGSRIGIGSDVAGSVRAPAHFSGCYSLRCSTGRWPKLGMNTSMPGQEGVPAVFSPMARTLFDLTYFTRSFIQCQPWRLDHSVHPIPWRSDVEDEYLNKKQLRIGVLSTDDVVDPSPACARALQLAVDALRAQGHDVVEVGYPLGATPLAGLKLASQLLNNDGCNVFAAPLRAGEWIDAGAAQMLKWARTPSLLRKLYVWYVRYVQRDPIWADLLDGFREQSTPEQWALVAKREAFRAVWHEWWSGDHGVHLDALLTVPNATPAVPHDGMHDAVSSCGYTFLFNLLDYTAGVLPVTKVDAVRDALPAGFQMGRLNGVARGAYKLYDARKMAGLPVGVQVVGQRLTEERTLSIMARVEEALRAKGEVYELLDVD